METQVRERLVAVLMSSAELQGLPGPAGIRRVQGLVPAEEMVDHKFGRRRPEEAWVTQITRHLTREGRV
jgi:hypothetical protein